MATTTNYSWETPDDTDLVKDGAAAIRTLGSSIDTTTKALNPSTTLGDIEYRSSTANTNTRLGIGSTGNVLTVAGGVPTWAAPATPSSGLNYITGATFTSVSSVSLPNSTFTSTYANYKIIFQITGFSGTGETRFRMRASGTDNTSAVYQSGGYEVNFAGGTNNSNTQNGTYVLWGNTTSGEPQSTQFEMTMMNPQASTYTVFNVNGGKGSWTWKALTGFHASTTSFDSMTLIADSVTMSGNYRVYGIANS